MKNQRVHLESFSQSKPGFYRSRIGMSDTGFSSLIRLSEESMFGPIETTLHSWEHKQMKQCKSLYINKLCQSK